MTSRLNDWWLPDEGIAHAVIQAAIQNHFGPDAFVKQGENEGKSGYWITSPRMLTAQTIHDLKLDTQRWEREQEQTSRMDNIHKGQDIQSKRYRDSATHQSRQNYEPTAEIPQDSKSQQNIDKVDSYPSPPRGIAAYSDQPVANFKKYSPYARQPDRPGQSGYTYKQTHLGGSEFPYNRIVRPGWYLASDGKEYPIPEGGVPYPRPKGPPDTVLSAFNQGANTPTLDDIDQTPLHSAVRHGQISYIFRLLDQEADVNAVDKDGRTPLHEAARFLTTENVSLLLGKGADINAVDKQGRTPLHDAARAGSASVVDLLLKYGMEAVIMVDENDRTPLHEAARFGRIDNVARLLDNGAEINAVDSDGRTSLHDAIRGRYSNVVDLLLNRRAIVAVVDKNGRTPLHDAIRTRASDIVCVIVSHIAGTQYANQLQLRSQRFISDCPLFVSADEGLLTNGMTHVVSIWVLPWNGLAIYRSCNGDIGSVLTVSRIEPLSDRFIARTVSEYLVEVYPTFGPGLLQWIAQICSNSARRAETNEARSCYLQQAPNTAQQNPPLDDKHSVLMTGLLDVQNLVVTVSTYPETPIRDVKAALVWVLAVLQNPKRENDISHLLLDQNSLDEGIPSPVAFKPQDFQKYCWLELFDSVTIMDITLPTVPPIDSTSEGLEIRPDILIELAKVDREDRIFGEVPILYGFDTALVPLEPGEGRRWHLLVTEGRQITPQRAEKELIKLGLDSKLLKGTIGDGNVYVGWCPNFLVSIYSDSMSVYGDCITKSSGVSPSGRVEEQSERSQGRDISFPLRIGWPGSSFGITPGAKREKKFKTISVIAPRNKESNFDRVLSSASSTPSILWDNDEKVAWLFPVVSVLAFASLRYIMSMRYRFVNQDGTGTGVHYSNYGSMEGKNTAEEAEDILRRNGPLVTDTVKGHKVNEPTTFEALTREIWEKMCDGEDLCIDDMTGLNRNDDQGIFGYDLSEATSGTRPQLRKLHYLPSMRKWSPLLEVRRVQVIFSHHIGPSLSCCCSLSHLQPATKGALTCVLDDLRKFYGERWKTVATNLDLTGLPIGENFEWVPVRRNGVDSHQEMQSITQKTHKRLKKRSVNGTMKSSTRIQWEQYELHRQYLISFG